MFDTELYFYRVNPLVAQINNKSLEQQLGKTLKEVVPQASLVLRSYIENPGNGSQHTDTRQIVVVYKAGDGGVVHFVRF